MDLLMGITFDGKYLFKKFMSHNEKSSVHFSKLQKIIKKDVECCLGVLQAHFAIIQNLNRQWDMATIKSATIGCVILHNIIIEYESNCDIKPLFDIGTNGSHLKWRLFFETYCQTTIEIENATTHYNLRNDLVEHLWDRKGNNMYWNKHYFFNIKHFQKPS